MRLRQRTRPVSALRASTRPSFFSTNRRPPASTGWNSMSFPPLSAHTRRNGGLRLTLRMSRVRPGPLPYIGQSRPPEGAGGTLTGFGAGLGAGFGAWRATGFGAGLSPPPRRATAGGTRPNAGSPARPHGPRRWGPPPPVGGNWILSPGAPPPRA